MGKLALLLVFLVTAQTAFAEQRNLNAPIKAVYSAALNALAIKNYQIDQALPESGFIQASITEQGKHSTFQQAFLGTFKRDLYQYSIILRPITNASTEITLSIKHTDQRGFVGEAPANYEASVPIFRYDEFFEALRGHLTPPAASAGLPLSSGATSDAPGGQTPGP